MAKAKKLAEGLKRIGDKVVKKRMTAKERNEMSKPFKKMLSEGQKSKKGMSKKEFDARVKKGMAEDARIAKVKAENMAAATGPRKPKKLKDGSGKGGVAKKVGGGMMKSKGMAKGGMMKSKGMAKGGMMKTKGYARGGAIKSKGMARGGKKGGGMAIRGLGKAFKNNKR